MNKSDSISKIVPALLKAQKAMGAATKGAKNPFFKSNYADYGAVLEACKDPLNDNALTVLQPNSFHDGKNFVETMILHESGEFVSGETEVVCSKPNDPQAFGSAQTYAARYGLRSMLALPTADDDAEGQYERKAKPAKTEVAPKPTQDIVPGMAAAQAAGVAASMGATKTPGFKPGKPIEAPKTNGVAKSEDW